MESIISILPGKKISKFLHELLKKLLIIQISRESRSNRTGYYISLVTPVFLVIFNSSYTFDLSLIKPEANFYKLQFIFDLLTYLTPDQLFASYGKGSIFLFISFALILFPLILIILQVLYLIKYRATCDWIQHLFDFSLLLTFRLLSFSIVSILINYIHIENDQFNNADYQKLSILFIVIYFIETVMFLIFFQSTSYLHRKNSLFSCSNLMGEVIFVINC